MADNHAGKQELARYDESPDVIFYDSPRFVTHIDDPAIAALTKWVQLARRAP